jgi:hypothetical protein
LAQLLCQARNQASHPEVGYQTIVPAGVAFRITGKNPSSSARTAQTTTRDNAEFVKQLKNPPKPMDLASELTPGSDLHNQSKLTPDTLRPNLDHANNGLVYDPTAFISLCKEHAGDTVICDLDHNSDHQDNVDNITTAHYAMSHGDLTVASQLLGPHTVPEEVPISLGNVHFPVDDARLKQEITPRLQSVIKSMTFWNLHIFHTTFRIVLLRLLVKKLPWMTLIHFVLDSRGNILLKK